MAKRHEMDKEFARHALQGIQTAIEQMQMPPAAPRCSATAEGGGSWCGLRNTRIVATGALMIETHLEGDRVVVSVTSERRPRLYFDQFALYDFSSKANLRDRFLARFSTHGEFMFSHINMMEVGALQGASASRVRDFLARIGVHWVPIEYEFDAVVKAENAPNPGARHPALSERLLEYVYRSRPPGQPVTLDAIVDEFTSADSPQKHREFLALVKLAMAANVAVWQAQDPTAFPVIRRAGPTLFLVTRLVRLLVEERKQYRWTANDAFDFSHALVPLVYADAVFLDTAWKKRLERLKLHGPFARVFGPNDSESFLQWFESFDQRGS